MITAIKDDEIIISDENNNERKMKILFTYENEERKHSYVFLYDDENDEDVIPFIYDEENKTLEEIEDDEEYNEVEEVFNAFIDEKLIEN